MLSLQRLLCAVRDMFRELWEHKASPTNPPHTPAGLADDLNGPLHDSQGSTYDDWKQTVPMEPSDIPEVVDATEEEIEEEICSVCQECEPKPDWYFCTLPCGHSAHPKCIKSWLEHSPNKDCPLCRSSLRYAMCGHPPSWIVLLPGKVIYPCDLELDCHGCLERRITDARASCTSRDFSRVIEVMEDCRCVMDWLIGTEDPYTTGPALLKLFQSLAAYITWKVDARVSRMERAIESLGREQGCQERHVNKSINLMKHLNSVYIHQVDTAIELMENGEDILEIYNRNSET